jgi:hypothetical protein
MARELSAIISDSELKNLRVSSTVSAYWKANGSSHLQESSALIEVGEQGLLTGEVLIFGHHSLIRLHHIVSYIQLTEKVKMDLTDTNSLTRNMYAGLVHFDVKFDRIKYMYDSSLDWPRCQRSFWGIDQLKLI